MKRTTLTLAVLASTTLFAAGCGGSSPSSSVAHLSSSTSTGSDPSGGSSSSPEGGAPTQQQMVALAQCMRSHGVPEFPEPVEGKLIVHNSNRNGHATGINPESAQFQAAQKACAKFAPNGGKPPSPAEQAKAQEQALKFSQCMRTHGVPSFPDPEFLHGGGAVRIRLGGKRGGPSGIDPNSPQFQAAQKACGSFGPKGGAVAVAP
jgi:hypothetical protein